MKPCLPALSRIQPFAFAFPVLAIVAVVLLSGQVRLSGQADQLPPQFTFIQANPQVVDVTDGPAQTNVEVRVTDDVSGFSSGSIIVDLEGSGLKWFFNNNGLIEGDLKNGLYSVPIVMPIGSPPGNRRLGVILFDGAGRSSSRYSDTATITVVNNGNVDLEPPTIHDVRINPAILDLTNGPGVVQIEIDVSDDASGIQTFRGDLDPPIANYSPDSRILYWANIDTSGEIVTLKSSYPLERHVPSGEWRLSIDLLMDRVYRMSHYNWDDEAFQADFNASVMVINPNEDLHPPTLQSLHFPNPVADTSYGPALIPYTVEFSDAVSGVDSIQIDLTPPSGGKAITSFKKADQHLSEGTVNSGKRQAMFEVPRFIEEGDWKVSARLWDKAGHLIRYGHGTSQPLPSGSTQTVTVQNSAGVDQERMAVTGFSYFPKPVDVTNSDQMIELNISFSDNLSGLRRGSLRIVSPDEEFSDFLFFNMDDLVSGTALQGTARSFYTIPRYSEPGEWKVKSFSLTDNAGNYLSLLGDPVFPTGIPSFIEVVNEGPQDREGPVFINLSLPVKTVDVTHGEVRIPIRLTATDDLSGVDSTFVSYERAGASRAISFYPSARYNTKSRNGNTLVMETNTPIRQYSPPGDYFLKEIRMDDRMGWRTHHRRDGDPPLPEGIPDKITVINTGPVDLEPPEFVDIRLSKTIAEVSDHPDFIIFEIDFTDDVSGVTGVSIELFHQEYNTRIRLIDTLYSEYEFPNIMGSPQSGSMSMVLPIPQYVQPGLYRVDYEIRDDLFQRKSLNGSNASFPFQDAKMVEIINTGPIDVQAPILTAVMLPGSVDTTHLAQTIPVVVSFIDDLAGISRMSFYAYSPSGIETISVHLNQDDLTSGSLTEGTFQLELTFPAFSEPGEWELSCYLQDALGKLNWPRGVELKALGLPESIVVENRQPEGYLWKGSEAYEGGWRHVEWFGWVQDNATYPYVYHLEHGWIYTSGSNLTEFAFWDVNTGRWWWVSEALYPYMYTTGGSHPGWYYYYAPFGSPGKRWFHDLGRRLDLRESEL